MTERCTAADTEEVRNLVARAADGVCRHDTELWVGTWAPDGVWALFDSEIVGKEEIRDRWIKGMGKFEFVALLVFNVIWSIRRGKPAGINPWGARTLEWRQHWNAVRASCVTHFPMLNASCAVMLRVKPSL